MEGEDEGGAGGDCGVEGEGAVDLFGAEGADRETEACAFAYVSGDGKRLEEVFTLVFGNAGTGVGDDELMALCAALAVGKSDFASFGGVFGGVFEQMCQNFLHFGGIDAGITLASVEVEDDARPEHRSDLVGYGVAVWLEVDFFKGLLFGRSRAAYVGEFADALYVAPQIAHGGIILVELFECRFHL